jgi:hypothetical protein
MSCILYYSKYCEVSKKYLQILSKSNVQKDIHFICIDKRVKESNNKTYIILENEQKIILPENVTRVPALLLLTKGYQVIYGEQILEHLKPRQEVEVRQATQNNMEPMAFSLGGGGSFGDIVSDQYSFLDQAPEDLEAKGNGGMRQMHNYVSLNDSGNFSFEIPQDATAKGGSKLKEGELNIESLQRQRDQELSGLGFSRAPQASQTFNNEQFNQQFNQQQQQQFRR